MLEAICGNKTIQKILIFLLVNGKCYGTQLHKLLKTPLTPIQKGLNRLELGNIIVSYYEGKTRVYQFNPNFPLLTELEQLLRKAYTLMAPIEKKQYYLQRENKIDKGRPLSEKKILQQFWEKLCKVEELSFHASSKIKESSGWNGKGKGTVSIHKIKENILIFNEKGSWFNDQEMEFDFTNSFRWTFDRDTGLITLEHLRHGHDLPVFLFHLAPSSNDSLTSLDSYLCGGDIYFGRIQFDRYGLRLNWRIIGAKKNEEINYYYTGKNI